MRRTTHVAAGAHLDLVNRRQDIRGDEAIGVDDESGARDRDSPRDERRGLVGDGNGKDAAHGSQRQRSRDGGDHAGEGEHRQEVTKKARDDESVGKKPTSGLSECENERKVMNESGGWRTTVRLLILLYWASRLRATNGSGIGVGYRIAGSWLGKHHLDAGPGVGQTVARVPAVRTA